MKYHPIPAQLFVENRERLAAKLAPNSIAIINSNDEMPRSADGTFPYRQNPDLFYLTGIDQEQTTLLLFPDAPRPEWREILFIREPNELLVHWEGHKLSLSEAREKSGIQNVLFSQSLDTLLSQFIFHIDNIYLNLNEHARSSNPVPDYDIRFTHALQQKYPLHSYRRLAPLLHDLRAIKSPIELELMKEAIAITRKAFMRVLQFVKPGVYEYEIEAEIMHEYLRNRANGPAYGSIIASGVNSCILHYHENNQACRDGDVLLMDFGAEYANYAADLTRTIPVNGRFTPRQKAVYNAVLRVMKYATSQLVVGALLDDYHARVGEAMQEELLQLGLITEEEVKKQNPTSPVYKRYFTHGCSHFLGLDVHDVGHRFKPMQAGMVFTCEPGIYIKKEGIGIRIENDILITSNGNIDLMADIPREADEIEYYMNTKTEAV